MEGGGPPAAAPVVTGGQCCGSSAGVPPETRQLSWLVHVGLSFDDPAVESQFAAWQAAQRKTVRASCHAKPSAPLDTSYRRNTSCETLRLRALVMRV